MVWQFSLDFPFYYLSSKGSVFNIELEIEKEMVEAVEPLNSPTTEQEMTEDYSDIDSHRIISIGGKCLKGF